MELAHPADGNDSRAATQQSKAAIRQRARAVRDEWHAQLSSEDRLAAEKNLTQGLADVLPASGLIAIYSARGSEARLDLLLKMNPGWEFVYPRVRGEHLDFFRPESPAALVPGTFGILEPDPARSRPVALAEAAAVLIPGLTFDRRGQRLGYGKGHYDRALNGLSVIRIGICFSVQISEEFLPVEDHDVPMDYVVTERFTLKPLAYEKRKV